MAGLGWRIWSQGRNDAEPRGNLVRALAVLLALNPIPSLIGTQGFQMRFLWVAGQTYRIWCQGRHGAKPRGSLFALSSPPGCFALLAVTFVLRHCEEPKATRQPEGGRAMRLKSSGCFEGTRVLIWAQGLKLRFPLSCARSCVTASRS